jgi:lactate dehydrogenase-like 2-hydroxyacid dehydrogenase
VESYDTQLNCSDKPLSSDDISVALEEFDILLSTITDRLDGSIYSSQTRVRLIANFGAGLEQIDLEAARRAEVMVTNTPDALTNTTAELAVTLMLMAARRAGEGERLLRAGKWSGWSPTSLIGQGLYGKLLGLIGFGRIAQATAVRARALGMRIGYFSRNPAPPHIARELAATRFETLPELASSADVLSLHVPGGEGTRHLVDADILQRMKPTAIVVNTARGSVVDEAALAEALRNGQIAAAGLDVFEAEPVVHPGLLSCENAVLLPHLGSATLETRTAMGMQAVENIAAFIAGRDPPNRVA